MLWCGSIDRVLSYFIYDVFVLSDLSHVMGTESIACNH